MKKKKSKTVGVAAGILSLVCMEVLRKTGCLAGWNELERVAFAVVLAWVVLRLIKCFAGPEKTTSLEGPVYPEQ